MVEGKEGSPASYPSASGESSRALDQGSTVLKGTHGPTGGKAKLAKQHTWCMCAPTPSPRPPHNPNPTPCSDEESDARIVLHLEKMGEVQWRDDLRHTSAKAGAKLRASVWQ